MMKIKDYFGKEVTVTDLDAAIKQLQEFDTVPCPFKMDGTDITVGQYHADILCKLTAIREKRDRVDP